MRDSIPWQRLLKAAAAVGLGALFLRVVGPVLLPFAIGLIPACAADKAAAGLQTKLRSPRPLTAAICVGLMYILFFLLMWLLGLILFRELEAFFRALLATFQQDEGLLGKLQQ